jgi:hypothetical protein
VDRIDAYQIPSYYNLDTRVGYDLNLGDRKLTLGMQAFNITNVKFLSDATDKDGTTFSYGFPGFGRNFNFFAKFTF